MHATQPQGGHCPEPRHPAETTAVLDLTGLLNDDTRFRTWIAQAATTAAHPVDPDAGYVVTDAGHQALDEPHGTTARVLRSAACYLERHGWIQGAYYDPTATVFTPAADMVGAIAMACYGGPCEAPAQHFNDPGFLDFEEAMLHLDRYTLVHDGCVAYDFNDVTDRRIDDVLHALRQAADTPAAELIDALKAIDARSADTAAIAQAFTPGGVWDEPNTVDCLLCGAPGGYPYCQGSFGGQLSCADAVTADAAQAAARGGDAR